MKATKAIENEEKPGYTPVKLAPLPTCPQKWSTFTVHMACSAAKGMADISETRKLKI
jgi:hypothetical protein